MVFINDSVKEVDFETYPFICNSNHNSFAAKSIIIATGASTKWLELKNEQELIGRGVSSCATCDGFFYRKKTVAVVGGGDTACEEALYLADYMTDVTIALFGRDIAREMAPVADIQPIATARTATATANDLVLDRLPEAFAKSDLKALKPKASDSTLRGLLKKWVDEGRIERDGANYRKKAQVSGNYVDDSDG